MSSSSTVMTSMTPSRSLAYSPSSFSNRAHLTRSTGQSAAALLDSSTNLDISVPISLSAWYMMAVAQAVKANLNAWRLHPVSRLRARSTVRSASPSLASQSFVNQVHRVDGLLEGGDLHGHTISPNMCVSPSLDVSGLVAGLFAYLGIYSGLALRQAVDLLSYR